MQNLSNCVSKISQRYSHWQHRMYIAGPEKNSAKLHATVPRVLEKSSLINSIDRNIHERRHNVLCYWLQPCSAISRTRLSEKDRTRNRQRPENTNIGWTWPFRIVIRFMVHCIMPPNVMQCCVSLTLQIPVIFLVQAYHGKFQNSVDTQN